MKTAGLTTDILKWCTFTLLSQTVIPEVQHLPTQHPETMLTYGGFKGSAVLQPLLNDIHPLANDIPPCWCCPLLFQHPPPPCIASPVKRNTQFINPVSPERFKSALTHRRAPGTMHCHCLWIGIRLCCDCFPQWNKNWTEGIANFDLFIGMTSHLPIDKPVF